MKIKQWQLFILASACFLFVGVISLFGKKYYMGSLDLVISVLYLILSIINYRARNKSNEIKLSDAELQNINSELRKLITEGKKIKAIKKYRIATRVGLKEAKEYVDTLSEKI